ncbi:Uma2 family endonuclease [Pyxidicoccus fallax]|uniref:Uma2 family endonuclease n=1 Tax=Pyxidicoccus fallax TaxID=394095 RepID=A0A848LI37_9BACT|nr:Uma2 family endonuclease [Pyxidicoccus fallax]NMO17258.1 Uma2 family endonuclease [Pyxidicoccus fallax]NPC78967.1 Uma2 family endonuclease [Pyxidicoccus fallax]
MERKRATYAELEALPDNVVGEIVDGVLYASPRPAGPHMNAYSRLGYELMGPFTKGKDGPGGWIIGDEPEVHLAEDVLVPDVAGWRRERMPEPYRTPFTTLAPDWLCEILSPSTKTLDRKAKLPVYAREGVRHVWLMDPVARTLEVLRLEGAQYTLVATHVGSTPVRAEPFEAIELDLPFIWGDV